VQRRQFLQRAALLGGAAALGGPHLAAGALGAPQRAGKPPASRFESVLEHPARESPIDTVVVLMMENRSFDHSLGWLADDDRYLERGRSRYGKRFRVDGKQRQSFTGVDGVEVRTAKLVGNPAQPSPFRGCGFNDPGHGWTAGRAQRDGGFLGAGSQNDAYALGYYTAADLPFTSRLAREFTVADRWHASVLGPTYPNRNYAHSAQSGTYKNNALPGATGGYQWETIWDRLYAANVEAAYYYSDLPYLALYGERASSSPRLIDQFFTDAREGKLPRFAFVDPSFIGDTRNDDHPLADIRAGQAFMRDVFAAFAGSKHWKNGLFVLTYDEWGGFFDHVEPPVLADNLASPDDLENFGQAGFRVPTVIASPYARRGFADHRLYDHSSILRFLEWQFLGAPPEGPGKANDTWFLTERDRNANNLGATLSAERIDRDVGFGLEFTIDPQSAPCTPEQDASAPTPAAFTRLSISRDGPRDAFEHALHAGWFERFGYRVDINPLARTWAGGSSIVHH
jgi:phospholipase C